MPQAFRMRLDDGSELFINHNGTKHLVEGITHLPPDTVRVLSQIRLDSLKRALNRLVEDGFELGKVETVGDWEIIISSRAGDELPVVKHALQR